jgi:hypothetical protein
MKLLYIYLFSSILSSCAYNLVEEIYFRPDKTCNVKIEVDFAKSLDSENKDIIVSMVTQAALGFADIIIGGDSLSKNKSLNEEINESLKTAQKDLKPVFFEVAADTLDFIQKDSIRLGVEKKDTLNILTPEQEVFIGDYIYYISQHLIINMNIDVPNNIMSFGFEFRNISLDTLDYYEKILINLPHDFDIAESTIWVLDKGIPSWNGNTIERSDYNFALDDSKKVTELDDQTKEAMKKSYYIIKYHFPSVVKKCSNSQYKIENDGKSVVFKQSLFDMLTDKPDVSTKIVIE